MGSRARHWAHMQKKKFPVEVKIFDQVFLYYTKMSIAVHMCVSLKWAHSVKYDTVNKALKHSAHIRQVSVPDTGDPHHARSHK